MKTDKLYLVHILECIDKIEKFILKDPSIIREDDLVYDAVLRNLQILAESSQRISNDTKTLSPSTNWKGISALRNVLVHDYLGIDTERILPILSKDLPEFKVQVQILLESI